MAYTRQTWIDFNPEYALSAVRMNHIEDGIESASGDVAVVPAPTGVVATDTANLVAAFSGAQAVRLRAGTYLVAPDTLVLDVNGQDVQGAGFGTGGTVLKAASAGTTLLQLGTTNAGTGSGGRHVHLAGVRLDGDSKVSRCLWVKDGSYSMIERVHARLATGPGIWFDTAGGAGVGNNNGCELLQVIANNNAGVGISCAADQADNNAIEFFGVRATFNGSHGILWKGLGFNMFGGHLESNGGYGFVGGGAADSITVQDHHLWLPWVEANTSGGVLFVNGKAQRCVYERRAISGCQEMDFVNSDPSCHQRETQATGKTRYKSGTDARYGEYGYDRIETQGGTDTKRDFFLAMKGTGGLLLGTTVSSNNPGLYQGSGSPVGVVSAQQGSIYMNTAGGAATSVYIKESGGTTSAGWVAK